MNYCVGARYVAGLEWSENVDQDPVQVGRQLRAARSDLNEGVAGTDRGGRQRYAVSFDAKTALGLHRDARVRRNERRAAKCDGIDECEAASHAPRRAEPQLTYRCPGGLKMAP